MPASPAGASPVTSPFSPTRSFVPRVSPSRTVKRTALALRGRERLVRAPALEEHVDLPAARQADAPGLVVGDPVGDELRLPAREDLLGFLVDVALDAASETDPHSAPEEETAKLEPRGRCGTACGDHGRDDDASPSSSQRSTSGRISFTRHASFDAGEDAGEPLEAVEIMLGGTCRRTGGAARPARAARSPASPSED